jgi:hypothetical protein
MPNNTRIATVGGTTSKTKVVGRVTVSGQKYSVEELPKKIKGGFVGLNKYAAKELKIPNNLKYNEVITVRDGKKRWNRRTIWHELIEQHAMRYGGLKYPEAHKLALRFENTNTTPKEALKWYKENK